MKLSKLFKATTFGVLATALVACGNNSSQSEKTTEAAYKANCKLIYKHCPILQKKELQEAYQVAEPYEIIIPVFDENLGEVNKLSNFILNLYGLGAEDDKASKVLEEEIEDIKN